MLQSLVPQSPISNMNPKRVDRDDSSGDETTTATKRRNLSDEASVSGEKALVEELHRDESESSGLRLLGLLLQCAECVSVQNLDEATDLLPEIAELSSPYGSSPQRVGAFFAHALQARVITSCLGIYSPLSSKTLTLAQSQKIFSALQSYNSISPLIKFSHFTANQAIFQALDGEDRVHVIDLDIMQGLQWPGLFHILASRNKKIRSMRVTGFGSSSELLDSTGKRLADFATSLGLPFEFQPVEGKIGNLKDPSQLGLRPSEGEAIVVHWMHHCLYDITGSDLGTLRLLTMLRPKLITIVEQDLSHGGGFLARFVDALHYYSALFDALGGDGLGGDSLERHMVEQQLFGCEIRNIVAVGGPKRTGEQKVERWGHELGRVGFRPVSLAGNPAAQASLLLGMFPWKGYTLLAPFKAPFRQRFCLVDQEMDTSNPSVFVNAELLRLYVGRRVRAVIQVLRSDGGVVTGKSTDENQIIVKGSPPVPLSNFVEVIGIADTEKSIRAEIWSNFGNTFDTHTYNQLCQLANGEFKHLFL